MSFFRTLKPEDSAIQSYLKAGRIPWSPGYKQYRHKLLQEAVRDPALLALFRDRSLLPEAYGFGVDERIVEYPWVLSRLTTAPETLLDAGSTLNYPYLLDLPQFQKKTVVIYTLAPESQEKRANVSYMYGDLRETLFRDAVFQSIVCISTLEHVGLDNTMLYTTDVRFQEAQPTEYRKVMAELQRLLAPGGVLLLTVPFGKKANFGWMQQFALEDLDDIATAFGGPPHEKTFIRYSAQGWRLATPEECATCEYFNVHTASEPAPDRAAAARAIACLAFRK